MAGLRGEKKERNDKEVGEGEFRGICGRGKGVGWGGGGDLWKCNIPCAMHQRLVS